MLMTKILHDLVCAQTTLCLLSAWVIAEGIAQKQSTHLIAFVLAGTVLKLGTKQHHDRLLSVIDSLDATGCFALTELGFGEPCSLHMPFIA